MCLGFWVKGYEFRVMASGFGVSGFEFGFEYVSGLGFGF
jgi:hypothetical protein